MKRERVKGFGTSDVATTAAPVANSALAVAAPIAPPTVGPGAMFLTTLLLIADMASGATASRISDRESLRISERLANVNVLATPLGVAPSGPIPADPMVIVGDYNSSETQLTVDDSSLTTEGAIRETASGERISIIDILNATTILVERGLYGNADVIADGETLTDIPPATVIEDDFSTDSSDDFLKVLNGTGEINIGSGIMQHVRASGGQASSMAWLLERLSADWTAVNISVNVDDVGGTADFFLAVSGDVPAAGYFGDPTAAGGLLNGYGWKKAVSASYGALLRVFAGATTTLVSASSGTSSGNMPASMLLIKTASAIKIYLSHSGVVRRIYTDSSGQRITGPFYVGLGGLTTPTGKMEFADMQIKVWTN